MPGVASRSFAAEFVPPATSEQNNSERHILNEYYRVLSEAMGPMSWWPGRTRFEVIVGAILTQNTAWTNVERALANLRRSGLLSPKAIEEFPEPKLALLIRPSGYFRQKAKKLKAFVHFLRKQYDGSLTKMFRTPTQDLRSRLLSVHGIGWETADSILLYAGKHAIFVVDAYTHRIMERHGLSDGRGDYEGTRALFENNLPRAVQIYNEFHALLVNVGKNWCRPREPRCSECPLLVHLPTHSPLRIANARPSFASQESGR